MENQASDATFYVRCGSGNLQGGGAAAWQFTDVYHPDIDQWHQQVRDPSLQVTDPVSLRSVPMDLSSFAVVSIWFRFAPLPRPLQSASISRTMFLHLFWPRSEWHKTLVSTSFLPGQTKRVYKNLGMLHHFNGSNTQRFRDVCLRPNGVLLGGAF